MTVLFVTQNGYGATRVRILPGGRDARRPGHRRRHAALSRPEGYTLAGMLLITLVSYLTIRKNYGWATVGFTVTAVYTLQLLTLNGEQFIVPRFIDTITGC
jgi:uncharacterized membrane protein YccC